MVKCWNFEVCEKVENKTFKATKPCCSEVCSTPMTLKERFNDKKALYSIVGDFMKLSKVGNVSSPPPSSSSRPISSLSVSSASKLVWDPSKTGGGISITENGTQCFLKEQAYLFRTTIANQGFTSGIHYW
jgi:hypothetical protein